MARSFKFNRPHSSPRPGNEREQQALVRREKRAKKVQPYSRKGRSGAWTPPTLGREQNED